MRRRSRRTATTRSALAAVAALLSCLALTCLGAGPAASLESLAVGDGGDRIDVTLTGWAPGIAVAVSACGNDGRNGASDCAVGAGSVLTTDAEGGAVGRIGWAAPPVACPCVIRAWEVTGTVVATAQAPARLSAEVTAAPAGPPAQAAVDSAVVSLPDVPDPPFWTGRVYLGVVGTILAAALVLVGPVVIRAAAARRRRPRDRPRDRLGRVLVGATAGCLVAAVAVAAVVGYGLVDDAARTTLGQRDLARTLAVAWGAEPAPGPAPAPGDVRISAAAPAPATVPDGSPLAIMHVPRWGSGALTVVEGVSQADLAKGPGHYPGTAGPGETGNFAVAGHRGPAGEPFNDIDRLADGDAVIVETSTAWYVYAVTGHKIVSPDRIDVVAPVPEQVGATPTTAVLTLTACHPKWSAEQRWITWAALVETIPKSTGAVPEALR